MRLLYDRVGLKSSRRTPIADPHPQILKWVPLRLYTLNNAQIATHFSQTPLGTSCLKKPKIYTHPDDVYTTCTHLLMSKSGNKLLLCKRALSHAQLGFQSLMRRLGDTLNPLFQFQTLLIYDDFDDDFYVHTPPPFAFIYAEARLCYGKNVRMGPKILSIGQKIIYTKLKSAIVST